MLQTIKSQRDLTVLITTHYMDEADKLCDRIAIVDHGKLVALDSPHALKASIPGRAAGDRHAGRRVRALHRAATCATRCRSRRRPIARS